MLGYLRLGVVITVALWPGLALAQAIAPAQDGTQTQVTLDGNQFNIDGGTRSGDGANLFHSFERFNVNSGQIANFLSQPDIQNILGRVTGGDASVIDGLIRVSGGNSNLFLLNPAGLVFGTNARLDVPGSFTATSATGLSFGDQWFNGVGSNDYASLVGDPSGFAFALLQPGSIFNSANLSVPFGQNLSLVAGTVLSIGTLSAPGGKLTIAAVPGESFVRFAPEGSVLALDLPVAGRSGIAMGVGLIGPISPRSIPELLAGQPATANALTVNPDGSIAIGYASEPTQPGDIAVRSANAGTATFSAINNLLLPLSQLETTGDLNLFATNTVIGRDSIDNPLQAVSGSQLALWGDRQINLFGLDHPASQLQSNSTLFLVSNGPIIGNIPIRTGASLSVTSPSNTPARFQTTYEPILNQDRDGFLSLDFSARPSRIHRFPFPLGLPGSAPGFRPMPPGSGGFGGPLLPTGQPMGGGSFTNLPRPGGVTGSSGVTGFGGNPTSGNREDEDELPIVGGGTSRGTEPQAPGDIVPGTDANLAPASMATVGISENSINTLNAITEARKESGNSPAGLGRFPSFRTEFVPEDFRNVPTIPVEVKSPEIVLPSPPTSVPGLPSELTPQPSVNINPGLPTGVNPPNGNILNVAGISASSVSLPSQSINPSSANIINNVGSLAPSVGLPLQSITPSQPTVTQAIAPVINSNNLSVNNLNPLSFSGGNSILPNSANINLNIINPGTNLIPSGSRPGNLQNSLGTDNRLNNVSDVARVNLPGSSITTEFSNHPDRVPDQVLDLQGLRRATEEIAACESTVWLDCQRTLVERSRVTGNAHQTQLALRSLGEAYYRSGQYTEALNTYRESQVLAEAESNSIEQARLESEIGNVHGAIGQYPQAIKSYERALKLAQTNQDHSLEGLILSNLGLVATNQNNYQLAQTYQEQALTLAQQENDLSLQSLVLAQLGLVYYKKTDYEQALTAYQDSLKLAQRINNPSLAARAWDNLGLTYYAQQDFNRAALAHTEALALARAVGDRNLEARSMTNLGDTQYRLNQLDQASENLELALKTWEEVRKFLTDDASRLAIFETQETTYSTLQTVLLAAQQPEKALEVNERSRAQALLKLLEGNNRNLSIAKLQTESAASIDLNRIRQVARAESATLISYAIERTTIERHGERKVVDIGLNIWVVQPSGNIQFRQVLLDETLSLREQIPIARSFLATRFPRRTARGAEAATINRAPAPGLRQLYRYLIEPITDLLPQKDGDRLIFMPHQDLFLVPFSALQNDRGQYLIERYSLAMAPSIQVLDRTQQRATQLKAEGQLSDRPLIVGNPTMPPWPEHLRKQSSARPDPLPNSEAEARAVAQMLNTQPLTGATASKAAVLERLGQASLIHLATHGILDAEHGLDSAIALAPSGDGRNDGWLTARDLLDLKLNAQLVVLSACNTGQGALSGDGIIGLSRSLLAAGAPSAIVTQWAVPDAPTAFLMTRFYEFLGQGMDKAAALRQATLVTMQQYPDPIDWAAFTLIGDAD